MKKELCLSEDSVSALLHHSRVCEWKHIQHADAHPMVLLRCVDDWDEDKNQLKPNALSPLPLSSLQTPKQIGIKQLLRQLAFTPANRHGGANFLLLYKFYFLLFYVFWYLDLLPLGKCLFSVCKV